jgi:hypothetical protein
MWCSVLQSRATACHVARNEAWILPCRTKCALALAVEAFEADTAVRTPAAGALISHASIADTLGLKPRVAACITDITDSVFVSADSSVIVHAAIEWNTTAGLTAFIHATASTMRIYFAFECLVIARVLRHRSWRGSWRWTWSALCMGIRRAERA